MVLLLTVGLLSLQQMRDSDSSHGTGWQPVSEGVAASAVRYRWRAMVALR